MDSDVEGTSARAKRRSRWAPLVPLALAVLAFDLFTVLVNDEWSLLGIVFGNGLGPRLLLVTGLGLVLYGSAGSATPTHSLFSSC